MLSDPPLPFHLGPDSKARNKAVATSGVKAGDIILSSSSLSTVLLPEEKGQRCDQCLRWEESKPKRCSGCSLQVNTSSFFSNWRSPFFLGHSYWYCSNDCQSRAWKSHHRRICKHLPQFLHSTTDIQQQLDSLLVAQLVGKHLASDEGRGAIIRHFQSGSAKSFAHDLESPLRALFTLQSAERTSSPPLPLQSNLLNATPKAALDHLFSTIQNNHFSVFSLYLHPIAHAIFPLASRAFNHSCLPNATASYRYENGSVWQDIRALRDIEANEEIAISYIDPASPWSSRQATLRRTYGFECTCARCDMKVSIPSEHALPPQRELAKSETALREWVFSDHPPALSSVAASVLPVRNLTVKDVPPALLDLVNQDDYLPTLSSRFSDLAHSPNPRSNSAVPTGMGILAMYFIIYPRNHPLIGLHCLELAKVVWNVGVISPAEEASCQSMARKLLELARSIMRVSLPSNGIEGEDGSSPWKDLQTMETLLGGDIKA